MAKDTELVDLDELPRREVGYREFTAMAWAQDWQDRTVELFCRPPICREYVHMGGVMVRIIQP